MPRRRDQIILDFKKTYAKLRTATDDTAVMLMRRDIDKLLDERLDERGAHPAACDCYACRRVVDERLRARSLREAS